MDTLILKVRRLRTFVPLSAVSWGRGLYNATVRYIRRTNTQIVEDR